MSLKTQSADNMAATAQVHSFAVEACYGPDDEIRPVRGSVVFRLFSVGRGLGTKLDLELRSDYYVYFDGDDDYVISALAQAAPHVPWHQYVFYRWLDQSRIQILQPETGRVVAQLETRRYYGRKINEAKLSSGGYGENVVSLAAARAESEDE